jgi:aspartyl protease family protein
VRPVQHRRFLVGQLHGPSGRGAGWVARGLVLLAMLGSVGPALAQSVSLAGRMGDRALLVVDGKPHTVAVGSAVGGVRLLRWRGDVAEISVNGQMRELQPGGTPTVVGGPPAANAGAREVVLSAGLGGHFVTTGAVNGKSARFMVDTGATLVAMGQDDAARLGVDLTGARTGITQTANGPVQVQLVTLSAVRVGEVEVRNVGAAVLPQPMPYLLLGNSFLTRFQMQRDNDTMRLKLR